MNTRHDGDDTGALQGADLIVKHVWIVTVDADRRILRDGALAINGDRIVAVGRTSDVLQNFRSESVIDGTDRFVVTPGFVNGHVHVTGEPITRGFVPDNTDWQENVFGWLIPTYLSQTSEDEKLSAQLAALEMLRTGTTCFVEAGTILDLDATFEALSETGIRGRLGQWLQDRAFDPADDQAELTKAAVRKMLDQQEKYPASADVRLAAAPCLVGHNTTTDDLWKEATSLARDRRLGVTAHMSADPADPNYYLETTGKRAIDHLASLGALGSHLSLTHAVHLDMNEVELLAGSGTSVTHCPMTAMKGGYGATAEGLFPEMAERGVNILLGTDGANNGNTSDLMRAMFCSAGIFKDSRRNPNLFPATRVLEMATINGAKAAQVSDIVGSIEVGKKADFVLHDRKRPEWTPLIDPVNQLVYAADGRGVHSVWVDGIRVVDTYRSTLIDEEKLYADVQKASDRLVARLDRKSTPAWPTV